MIQQAYYNEGKSAYEEGSWDRAIDLLSKIETNSTVYAEAQSMVKGAEDAKEKLKERMENPKYRIIGNWRPEDEGNRFVTLWTFLEEGDVTFRTQEGEVCFVKGNMLVCQLSNTSDMQWKYWKPTKIQPYSYNIKKSSGKSFTVAYFGENDHLFRLKLTTCFWRREPGVWNNEKWSIWVKSRA